MALSVMMVPTFLSVGLILIGKGESPRFLSSVVARMGNKKINDFYLRGIG